MADLNMSEISPEFDVYAYREVRKLTRHTGNSVKSDHLDELPQTRHENSAEIVFLDKDDCTTTTSHN
jgi:hypothetical protein